MAREAHGPFEVTVKENGCIIFAAALSPNQLLVTSKHAMEDIARPEMGTHAKCGREWLNTHLAQAGRTPQELATFLHQYDLTAVFELCDDAFEEHVLEYPPERRGLYLHGINRNTAGLITWTSDNVHAFAHAFGFIPIGYVQFDTLAQVQAYTDQIRHNCMLDDGRAVEGFVVRCKRGHGELEKDFFFKVKYDDPYLMFREWRELTKKILTKSGAKDGLRFTYKLSKEYVDWLQDSMKQHPQWFVDYNKGRGIIHVRNAFIEWWQSSHQGVNIVTLSAERMRGTKAKRLVIDLDEDVERETAPALIKTTRPAQAPQVVLAPIATIGCGKTTLAIALHELFGWAHVQNDNITAKKAAPVFYKQLVDNLKKSRVIIADKNNHLGMHRKGITDAVRKAYPKAYIIALNFIPTNDPEARNELFQLTRDRVVDRGENHQSLTPNKSMDFMGIMRRFQNDFVPVSFDNADDAGLDEIIQIDPAEELRVKIQQVADIVCPLVGTSADISDHDLERAMHAALTYTPLVSKDAGSQRAAYWGLSVGTDVIQLCRDYFDVHPDVDQGYFLELLAGGRITADRLHVTLIHIKETKDSEIIRAKWKRLETHAKVEAVMHASGLVWNGRCMALAVTAIEPSWIWETRATLEPVSHITLGTTDATIKPVEAKSLVESAWTSPASGTVVIRFPQPWTIRGKLTGYTV